MIMEHFPPGTATLLEYIDKKLTVVLRDGRILIGKLRSIDQYANLVLHNTIERIHVNKEYGDIYRGIFIIRGENVVLLGQMAEEGEINLPFKKVSPEDILAAQKKHLENKQEQEKVLVKSLKERGLTYTPDLTHDDMF